MNLKKKILQFLYNVYVMFYYDISWFYQDFESEKFVFLKSVLSSHS